MIYIRKKCLLKKLSRVFCVLFLIYEYFCPTFSYIDSLSGASHKLPLVEVCKNSQIWRMGFHDTHICPKVFVRKCRSRRRAPGGTSQFAVAAAGRGVKMIFYFIIMMKASRGCRNSAPLVCRCHGNDTSMRGVTPA